MVVTTRSCSALCVGLITLACNTERVVDDIGSPWKDLRLFTDRHKAEARLLPGVRTDTVLPQRLYAGFRPKMSSAEAKNELGDPTSVRHEQGATAYVYSQVAADVEIVEWLLSPSGPGAPTAKPYLTSKVRIRFHSLVESEALRRAIDRVRSEDPAANAIVVLSSNDADPVLELELQGSHVVAATIR